MNNWSVYLLECSDKTYYCGCTNNLKKRLEAHNEGIASKYTRGRLPVKLLISKSGLTKSEAMKMEYQVKKQPKEKKLKLFE